MVRKLALFAILCANLAAQNTHPNKPAQTDPSQARIASLEKKVADLEAKLKFDEFLIEQKQSRTEAVQLDPSSREFERIDSDSASFLVMVEDATPYLDGYRLMLKVGNPSNADFLNVKVKIRWSKPFEWKNYSDSAYAAWQKAIHEKEVTINERIRGGAWNRVSIDLTPCKADELGFLEASLKSPTIALDR